MQRRANVLAQEIFDDLRFDIAIKYRNGVCFLLSATLVWLVVAAVWSVDIPVFNKALIGLVLSLPTPLIAIGFAELIRIPWRTPDNPLSKLSYLMRLSTAFLLPIQLFVGFYMPQYFLVVGASLIGAHYFLHAWLFNTRTYVVLSTVIILTIAGFAVVSTTTAPQLLTSPIIPLFMAAVTGIAALFLFNHADKYAEALAASEAETAAKASEQIASETAEDATGDVETDTKDTQDAEDVEEAKGFEVMQDVGRVRLPKTSKTSKTPKKPRTSKKALVT
jgi:hypothetical protein